MSLVKPLGFALVAFGFAIGFNSHISIFISLIPIGIFWLIKRNEIRKQINKKFLLYSVTLLLIGILPNIVFDLTYQFVNTKRLFGLVTNPQTESFYPATPAKILGALYGTSEIFIPSVNKQTAPFIFWGLVILAVITYRKSKNKSLLELLLLSIFIPAIVFLFWKGNFSEYYLTMITVSAFIIFIGFLIDNFRKQKLVLFICTVFFFL